MLGLLLRYPLLWLTISLFLVIILRTFAVPDDKLRCRRLMIALCGTMILQPVDEAVLSLLSRLRPLKYDLYLYRMDAVFGVHPSFALGSLILPHLWASEVLLLVYQGLPFVILVVYAAYLWLQNDADQARVVKAFSLNLLVAPIFYYLVPVCGPAFAFPSFPTLPGPIVPHAIALAAAPNGVPSVHCSSALLILWFSRRWMTGAVLGWVFLALTVTATLVSGEHYWLDLVAAIPYTAGVIWLSRFPRSVLVMMPGWSTLPLQDT